MLKFVKNLLLAVLFTVPAMAAQKNITIGTPNAGRGEVLFSFATDVQANFTDVYSFLYAPITGPVSIAPGTNTSVIGANVLSNSNWAFMPAQTIKCNYLSTPSAPLDCNASQISSILGVIGTGGTSGLSSVGLTLPPLFQVSNSPVTGTGGTINVTFAGGQAQNQVLATPNGTSGAVGLRTLQAADIPNLTGQVTSTAGVTTLSAASVTNAQLAPMAAASFKCNTGATAAAPADCPLSSIPSGGGGGGTGTLSSVGLSVPSGFSTIGSPLSSNGSIQLIYAAGEPANQFLATPNGSTGQMSLRNWVWSDAPTVTGDVLIDQNGNAQIQPNVVTNTEAADMPSLTFKCNPNNASGNPADCTAAQVNSLLGNSGATGDTQLLELCAQSGIDKTGATDSRAAVNTQFQSVAGTNVQLYVNCPILIHVGTDSSKAIFVASGTNLTFGPNGRFIVDNVGTGVFIFEDAHDITWTNTQILYQGAFFLNGGYTNSFGPVQSTGGALNDTYIKPYLAAHGGVTFSSGSAIWPGPTNRCGIFQIEGNSYRINFVGTSRAYVADGSTAGQFIPVVFTFGAEWNSGVTVTSSLVATTSNSTVPYNIVIDGWDFDGVAMGIVGEGSIRFSNSTSHRYSDFEDGTNGTVQFSGSSVSGSTGTLSSSWTYPTGTYGLTFNLNGGTTAASGDGTTITINFSGGGTIPVGSYITTSGISPSGYNQTALVTASSSGSVSFSGTQTGAQTGAGKVGQLVTTTLTKSSTSGGTFSAALVQSANPTAGSGNYGGIDHWLAPPHLFYMVSGETATYPLTSVAYPITSIISKVIDYGVFVGSPVRRSTGSGSLLSFKLQPANDTIVSDVIGLRKDGMFDILSYGFSRGEYRNIYAVMDSSIQSENSGCVWGVRFPSSPPITAFSITNMTLVDTAAVPCQFPFLPFTNSNINQNNTFTGIKVYLNDWPSSATWQPGFSVAGNTNHLQAEIFFNNCNSTKTYTGSLSSGVYATNSDYDVRIYGWRSFSAVFSSISSTGGTLANAWTQSSGTYQVQFSTNQIRYVNFTNGSTSVGGWAGLSGTPNTTAYATGMQNNYAGYKNRVSIASNGLSQGTRAHIVDVTNGFESTYENGLVTESWSQTWAGAPASGGAYTIPGMSFPPGFGLDKASYTVDSSLGTGNGLSGVNFGYSGNTSAFATNLNTSSASNGGIAAFSPHALTGTTSIILTPSGGNFDGGGNAQVTVRGTQYVGGQ